MLARIDPDDRLIRSPLEARLNAFLRDRGFPPWESNARIRIGGETIEPDVLWRPQRVVVEADGRDPHLAPLTFASDRRWDRRLRVEGWEPVRVTTVDLADRPDELDADLRALLGLASPQ
jgi:very-short-patch-repair endonuclease